jgi:hypothetical protein
MTVHGTAWIVGLCLAGLCTTAAIAFADGAAKGPATQPSAAPTPQLSPSQVVKVVMTALKDNDAADSGIRVTFKFASPANQQQTGPIDRFIPMVKSDAYAPMLNHKSATVRELAVQGDQAAELVTLTDAAGHTVYYMFQLSKQHDDGPLKDCWMTDGVIRVQPKADTHTA